MLKVFRKKKKYTWQDLAFEMRAALNAYELESQEYYLGIKVV